MTQLFIIGPLLFRIIYIHVPTIHKQPTEPRFANDTDFNSSTFWMLLVTVTVTSLFPLNIL